MLLLAITAAVFGWLAARVFSAAPFVAGNVIAATGVVVFGVVNDWTLLHILGALAVTIVSLQAGFVLATLREASHEPRRADATDATADKGLVKDSSTIDGPRQRRL